MIGEEGYRALERGDLITAFNEFSSAEKYADTPVERARMMINQGAILIAMGKYNLAIGKLTAAKTILNSVNSEGRLLAAACLNISKAMILADRIDRAEAEADCAEHFLERDDPHLLYVKALIKFHRNDVDGLLKINAESLAEPYRGLIKVLQLRANSDDRYRDVLQEVVPSAGLREALGLV